MTIGMKMFEEIKRTELIANQLGFKFEHSKTPNYRNQHDGFALVPLDDSLPIYSRGVEIWFGDIESVQAFIAGVKFLKNYYFSLNLITDAKIHRKEQDYRNQVLVNIFKES